MQRGYQRFRILVFVLLILMCFCPVYFQGNGMGDASSIWSNMILGNSENESRDDLILDPPNPSKGIFSALLGNLILLEVYPFKNIFSPLFHAPDFAPKTAILRC